MTHTQTRIVLIEDDQAIGRAAQRYLAQHYAVEWYRDGAAGMTDIVGDAPDVIVLDILLPGGLKGFSILQLLRERGLTDRTIVATALTDAQTERFAAQHGATRFIRKPYSNHALRAAIEQVLSAHQNPLSPNPT